MPSPLRPVAGGAEGAEERGAVGGELALGETLGADAVLRPERFRIVAAPQRQQVEDQRVDLLVAEAEHRHLPSRARPAPGARKCSASQFGERVLAGHARVVEPLPDLSRLRASDPDHRRRRRRRSCGSRGSRASGTRPSLRRGRAHRRATTGRRRSPHGPSAGSLRTRCATLRRSPRRDAPDASRTTRRSKPVPPTRERSGAGDALRTARPQRAAALVEAVTGEAVVALEQRAAACHLGEVRHREVRVAAAAAGVGVALRQHRLRPVRRGAVRIGLCPSRALGRRDTPRSRTAADRGRRRDGWRTRPCP